MREFRTFDVTPAERGARAPPLGAPRGRSYGGTAAGGLGGLAGSRGGYPLQR
jgi:hypothetical protein